MATPTESLHSKLALESSIPQRTRLKFGEEVFLALDTLRRNPLRSCLTILGIVIGIIAVVAVTGIINGLNSSVLSDIGQLGSDSIIIYRFPFFQFGRPPLEYLNRKELNPEWAKEMETLPHVVKASPSLQIAIPEIEAGIAVVRRGDKRAEHTILQGNTASIAQIFDLRIEFGRFFTETEEDHRSPVVVLGYKTTRILFPDDPSSAIGQEVTIDGQLYTVIGTLERQRQGAGQGDNARDNIGIMPVRTLRKLYPNQKDYFMFVKAVDAKHVDEAVDEIRGFLRVKRRLTNDRADDFVVYTSNYFRDLWNQISTAVFILMFAIASVGLIVGGIGVMNIMLVSVTERTREIGVRKAVGAKRNNILVQFLVESVTLSALGGVFGVILGTGITLLLGMLGLPARVSPFWISAALIICAMIGVVFGVYPAWKAARLDPVEALRYE
jgi:putative ABC transport system permease protein